MPPIQPQELTTPDGDVDVLWQRGGLLRSLLANDDEASFVWRRVFIRSYLERDIPQFGIRVPVQTLERFWTMLAHGQGGVLNTQRLAYSLDANWRRELGRICDRGADRCGSKRDTTPFLPNASKLRSRSGAGVYPRSAVRDRNQDEQCANYLEGASRSHPTTLSPGVGSSYIKGTQPIHAR